MELIKQYGKPAAVALGAAGLILIILSFAIPMQPINAHIWLDGAEEPAAVSVRSPFAANWLLEGGIRLYPEDSIWYGGVRIPHDFKLPYKDGQLIAYKPAVPIRLRSDGGGTRFYSGAVTLGEALWERNIVLKAGDALSMPMGTPLTEALTVTLTRSQPVAIQLGDKTVDVPVAAARVGDALAEAGYALQFLDYSIPTESALIPNDRAIRLVRVREEIINEKTTIPFTEERVSDPDINVGEEVVLQAGENGTQTATVRVRYEDGEETLREVLAEWVSKAPTARRVAYGGNVVEQTYQSPDGSVDYWLEKEVYITSYLDTGSPTASGVWPYYGSIAVSPEWYSILKGASIYVPGYGVGTVMDVCPGCAGKDWIDVFIPTDQYIPWSKTLTVYFLPPVPDGFTGELP